VDSRTTVNSRQTTVNCNRAVKVASASPSILSFVPLCSLQSVSLSSPTTMSVSGKDDDAQHKRRTSLFHSLKKVSARLQRIAMTLQRRDHEHTRLTNHVSVVMCVLALQGMFSGGEKTVDPSFESAKADFIRLNDQVHKVRQAIGSYTAAMKQLFLGSKTVCDGFGDAMEDAPRPHPYQAMLKDIKSSRADMVSDRGEGAIVLGIDGTVLKKLNEELEIHKTLLVRIADREELRKEMDYYSNKVDELRAEREKRATKGKDEKPEQVDKFERNNKKFNDMKLAYTTFNELLISDLTERWTTRVRVLGPAMNDFVACERQVLVLYASCVRDVASVEASRFGVDGDYSAADRAVALQRQASRSASVIASQADAQAAQARAQVKASMNGSNAALASYAASAAVSEARSQAAPIQQAARNQYDDAFGAPAQFHEFKDSSSAQAKNIFARSPSSPHGSASARPPPPPPADPWDAPPMLSHIQGSGVGVAAAVDMSNMNTNGSFASHVPGGPHSPSPPPPPPAQPVFYGAAPVSPPGGLHPPPARPRMDSFGALANRHEYVQTPPPRGEGEGHQPPPPPRKSSFNPFDES
jgi:hypothetical protein